MKASLADQAMVVWTGCQHGRTAVANNQIFTAMVVSSALIRVANHTHQRHPSLSRVAAGGAAAIETLCKQEMVS